MSNGQKGGKKANGAQSAPYLMKGNSYPFYQVSYVRKKPFIEKLLNPVAKLLNEDSY